MATLIPGPAFSWESQVKQYAYRDEPGIHLERHAVGTLGALIYIDCLLYRDEDGLVVGILNHYPQDNPYERAGSFNLFVHPQRQRQGIGTALLTEGMRRWHFDLEEQNLTFAGLAFVNALLAKGLL